MQIQGIPFILRKKYFVWPNKVIKLSLIQILGRVQRRILSLLLGFKSVKQVIIFLFHLCFSPPLFCCIASQACICL